MTTSLFVREPKEPNFIKNYVTKLKESEKNLSPRQKYLELSLNKSRKKMMSSQILEDNLEGKAKDFIKQKRLTKIRSARQNPRR